MLAVWRGGCLTREEVSPTTIFAPASTPAHEILGLATLVVGVTALIFVCVYALLIYAVVRFRKRPDDDGSEPAQVYGSNRVEIAWTVIPILIVVVLFLSTARVITAIQNAQHPEDSIHVVAVGHQFWWEYRYPGLGVVTANELHVPVSDPARPTPTLITLLSADANHSFWIPRLGGKTDLIPNQINSTWIDPYETGLYLGQCGQYCGTQHAKMLLRVYVDSRDAFDRWVRQQGEPASEQSQVADGRRVFESTACINCHTVSGTVATGQFGPDLTHLMSRDTIGSGIIPNTVDNLRAWIRNPDSLKPGSRMPSMGLTDQDVDAVTAYLATLR
jgi:cytochrome c oxidase subunit 2